MATLDNPPCGPNGPCGPCGSQEEVFVTIDNDLIKILHHEMNGQLVWAFEHDMDSFLTSDFIIIDKRFTVDLVRKPLFQMIQQKAYTLVQTFSPTCNVVELLFSHPFLICDFSIRIHKKYFDLRLNAKIENIDVAALFEQLRHEMMCLKKSLLPSELYLTAPQDRAQSTTYFEAVFPHSFKASEETSKAIAGFPDGIYSGDQYTLEKSQDTVQILFYHTKDLNNPHPCIFVKNGTMRFSGQLKCPGLPPSDIHDFITEEKWFNAVLNQKKHLLGFIQNKQLKATSCNILLRVRRSRKVGEKRQNVFHQWYDVLEESLFGIRCQITVSKGKVELEALDAFVNNKPLESCKVQFLESSKSVPLPVMFVPSTKPFLIYCMLS